MKTSILFGSIGAAVLITSGAQAAIHDLQAHLTGAQEVPPNASALIGNAVQLKYNDVTREVTGGVDCASNALTGAHIHLGACGVEGAPFVTLTGTSCGSAQGVNVPAGTIVTVAEGTALLTGGAYLNLHTAAFPNGEMRGQIFLSPDAGSMVCPAPDAGAVDSGTDAAVPDPVVDSGTPDTPDAGTPASSSGTPGTPDAGSAPPAADDGGCSTTGMGGPGISLVGTGAAFALALLLRRRAKRR